MLGTEYLTLHSALAGHHSYLLSRKTWLQGRYLPDSFYPLQFHILPQHSGAHSTQVAPSQWSKTVGVPEPGQSCNGKPWPEAPLINPAETFSKLHHSLRLLHPILSLSPLLLPQEPHHKVFPSWIFPLTDMFLRHILQFCHAGSFTECQSWPLTWFWTLTYLGSICFTRVPEFKGLPPKTEWSSSKEICLRHHITSPIPITNAIVVEHSVSVGHSFSSEWWHYHSRNKK